MTTTSYSTRSAVGVRHLFPSKHYSDARSRLSARGTMPTTSYRISSAVGIRLFSVVALPCCPVASWRTRNDDNDILPQPLSGGYSSLFPSWHYPAVRSRLCARRTMTTTSYRVRAPVGVRHLLPSKHYSDVRSRLSARGTTPTTSCRICSAVGLRHFIPSAHYPAVRSRLAARGTMTTTSYGTCSAEGIHHFFFRRRTTLLSGRVFAHAER
ncbi:uncharacterized protein TNCV_3695851 [Trichonephila clavipes]|nr:uncharacterized protein TNCV_3695851 [Trichonephila clavipes]